MNDDFICPFCGEDCGHWFSIDQGGKWGHVVIGCLETCTYYDMSPDAPWQKKLEEAFKKRSAKK